MLRWRALSGSTTACAVDAQGAVGDNRTDDTAAIQLTVDKCRAAFPNGATVLLSEKKTYRVRRSIALASNLTLAFGPNATLFSALKPSDPIFQHPRCPTLYWPHGPTAVLCGTNLTNVALLGADETSSVLDGGGWPWYAAGEANSSMQGAGPRLFEVAWSRNLTLSRLAFVNSPAWNIHPTFSTGVMAENLRILAPRFTPNTDGFDPDSCADVTLRDSHIDVGDDGISIKSGNSTQPGSSHVQMPSRNIHVHRVTVLSRNLCVGSATYGGVYDLVVEDCTIGDDAGSAPWAIKYKSHQSYPGAMRNHTWRRLRVGSIQPNTYQQPHGGYFMSIELRYHPLIPNRTCHPWDCPSFEGVAFEDIRVTAAARAGDIAGFRGDLLRRLSFRNISFAQAPRTGWSCGYVDLASFEAHGVQPRLECSEGPARRAAHGTVIGVP